MINLWKEGFKTKSYNVLTLPLKEEAELSILTHELGKYVVYHAQTDKNKSYITLDTERMHNELKGDALVEKISQAADVLITLLGEDYVRELDIYSYIFELLSLSYEIKEFKENLKKK